MSALQKRVLITGCGRSGTKYAAALLTNLGLDVRHEAMGKDGIATWCMAVDCEDSPWGGGRRGIEFKSILHQVRHPLKVIPSVTTFAPQSWQFIERYIPYANDEPVLLRSAKYWYYWNLEAERTAQWSYRLEAIKDVFPEFCSRLGISADLSALERTSTLSNSRKIRPQWRWATRMLERFGLNRRAPKLHFMYDQNLSYTERAFTWDELEKGAPGWAGRIKELARHYGYAIQDGSSGAV